MTCCTARTFLLTVCALQMLATVQREVFDFLGYMWAPIIGNFFQLICVIFGIFGIYHFRPKYLAVYCVWSFLWIGWNVFIICLYLEVGILRIESEVLNLGTGSRSWWTANGIGCKLISNYSVSELEKNQFSTPPSSIEGCLLQYYYVECVQAAVQCLLALFGFVAAGYVIYVYTEEDDSSTRRNKHGLAYSIEYHASGTNTHLQDANGTLYQRPMTPRKVKRRSTRSKRGSLRQSYYQNPVTKIMNQSAETSSIDSYHLHPHKTRTPHLFQPPPPPASYPGHANPVYVGSQPNSRASSFTYLNADPRLSPIYVNDSETVI